MSTTAGTASDELFVGDTDADMDAEGNGSERAEAPLALGPELRGALERRGALSDVFRLEFDHAHAMGRVGLDHHERLVKVGTLGDERTVEGYWSPASALSGEYTVELEPDSTDGPPHPHAHVALIML